MGNDPLRVNAFAFLKLIGSNLEGSGTGPDAGTANGAVEAPPPRIENNDYFKAITIEDNKLFIFLPIND